MVEMLQFFLFLGGFTLDKLCKEKKNLILENMGAQLDRSAKGMQKKQHVAETRNDMPMIFGGLTPLEPRNPSPYTLVPRIFVP